jgi:glutaredoxin
MSAPTWFDRHVPTYAALYRRSRLYRACTWGIAVLLPLAVILASYVHWQQMRHDPRRQAAGEITVLVGRTCPYSRELERALTAAAIPYQRLDVDDGDADGPARWAFYRLGARGVPVTVIGGEVIPGLQTAVLREALARAGHDTARLKFVRETEGGSSAVAR